MKRGRTELLRTSIRLVLWLPVLLWVAWKWGVEYARFFSPLYREVLDFALADFRVLEFGTSDAHEKVFRAKVIATHYLFMGGRVLPSGFTIDASTPIYITLVHPVVLAAAALVWPRLSWRGRLVRLGLSLPFLLVLEMLDAPLVLASTIHDLLSFNIDPVADRASRLVDWVHVMDGGGRLAMALAGALGAAACQERLRHVKRFSVA